MYRKSWVVWIGCVAAVVWAAPAFGIMEGGPQVLKPGVPDADKPGVPPGPPPGGDNSCWMATAANLLAGAGYGTPGAGFPDTPQNRADNIYGQLGNDLGIGNLGCADLAINYWLYMYGKNPDNIVNPGQPNPDFAPANTYTDVTIGGAVDANTYDFLLDELTRCQYVGVNFDSPTPGHCMTLVGGNKESANPGASQSIWHDSDRDMGTGGGPDDDQYANSFNDVNAPPGVLSLPGYALYNANKWITLCPGKNKPEEAIRNYDVAWFQQDPDQDGDWDPMFRVAGLMNGTYQGPQGQTNPDWDLDPEKPELYLPNKVVEDWQKEIWLLVDYTDRDNCGDPGIVIRYPDGTTYDETEYLYSSDGGQVLIYWLLPDQPPWEVLVFPDIKYRNLTGDVKDWNVATICVPEPATLGLLALGGLGLLLRRKR